MKKLFLFLFLIMFVIGVFAQTVSKTINVSTSGTLTNLLTSEEKATITNLTITGNIDINDFITMRVEMPNLAVLDIYAVSLPNNEMPSYSFYNGYTHTGKATLKNIILPNTITSIANAALISCSGLTSVSISNSVTSIGDEAFDYCLKLSNITIPNSVTTIGRWAFDCCFSLKTLIIPNSVISIGYQSFSQCDSLTSITIGNSVTSIGGGAFTSCPKLTTIYSLNETPPAFGDRCFDPGVITAIYVPVSAVSTYKAAPGWSDVFKAIIMADPTSITYGITVQIGTGGIVKENNIAISDGSVISLTPGSILVFTITALAGYEISTLTYNGTDVKSQITNNQYTTPTMNTNVTLGVTFQKVQYHLSLKSADSGTMNLLCDYGATPAFDFTPSSGWKVNTVIYNGLDVTASLVNGVYTVPAITDNSLLNISFVSTAVGAPELINNRVKVYITNSEIIVEGTSEGEQIVLYTVSGLQLQSFRSEGERISIPAKSGCTYLVKTREKTYKVIL